MQPTYVRSMKPFTRITAPTSIPEAEQSVIELWRKTDAFKRSIEQRPEDSSYTFYDGPPFATGSPHYGHILVGVIKDVVPRYWTMRGHRIERKFGWDTHGLPVEIEVEKELGISGPAAINEFGIGNYNELCRALVEKTTDDWEDITERIGRWVDFHDDYKTMDPEFMESVWWVFKQLWDKGYVYSSHKVVPYSWGATTVLSNFEANENYQDVDDPSIVVRLQVTEGNDATATGEFLTIWTTTPWTLPSNLGVAVGTEIVYALVDVDGQHHWVAEALADEVFPGAPILKTAAGRDLVGTSYEPPFDYFIDHRSDGAFKVFEAPDISTTDGTGMVHMAPAYGEVDFYASKAAGIDFLVDPVDARARFNDQVPDVAGEYVKDADKTLMRLLKASGKMVSQGTIRHAYPFCDRTNTPLIYKAVPSWYVKVEQVSDRMVELNKNVHWVPDAIGSNRFGNWLDGARDWAVSRNRYWGSCIPIWTCENGHDTCIGSIAELAELSGVVLEDLHRHFVDPVTFPCPECGSVATRVPEVLDCWFESASMPYGQMHYPFENQAHFEANFPAKFITEGLDQTRGWFYTLMVLSTLLFDTEPFENCIVTGLILAEDGTKMSKRLKNYPDPSHLLEEFGADALRAYLIDSPLLRSKSLKFRKEGIAEAVRSVLLPLWNATSFFTTYAEADDITLEDLRSAPPLEERPELDQWLISVLQSLISSVNKEMEGYYLYNVISPTLAFIDDLTNWYIRRSRRRFWRARSNDDADKLAAFATLYEALTTFTKVLAPVLPFITEQLHQELVVAHDPTAPDSVHLCDFPTADTSHIQVDIEIAMEAVRSVVRLGHNLRKQHHLKVRQPLGQLTVLTSSPLISQAVVTHLEIITSELNVKEVVVSQDETGLLELTAKADFKKLGPKFGADVKNVSALLSALSSEDCVSLLSTGSVELGGYAIDADDIVVQRSPKEGVMVVTDGTLSVALDTHLTPELVTEGVAREVVSAVQKLRRDAGFDISDRITLGWSTQDEAVQQAISQHKDLIAAEVLATSVEEDTTGESVQVGSVSVRLKLTNANS